MVVTVGVGVVVERDYAIGVVPMGTVVQVIQTTLITMEIVAKLNWRQLFNIIKSLASLFIFVPYRHQINQQVTDD